MSGKETVHGGIHRSLKVDQDPQLADVRITDRDGRERFRPVYLREYITYDAKYGSTNYHVTVQGPPQGVVGEDGI